MAYRNAWLITEGLIVVAYILVILELYKALLGGLPGITTVAQRYIKWTILFATGGSLLVLAAEHAPIRGCKLNCVNGHQKDHTKETRWPLTSNSSISCWPATKRRKTS
jgi:hypothetical protein